MILFFSMNWKKIIAEKDSKSLLSNLISIPKTSKQRHGVFCRTVNLLLDWGDLESLNTIFEDCDGDGSGSIQTTRYFLLKDDIESAIQLLKKPERKRQFNLVIDYLIEHGRLSEAFSLYFSLTLPLYLPDESDIRRFKFHPKILEKLIGQPIKINSKKLPKSFESIPPNDKLVKLSIPTDELSKITDILKIKTKGKCPTFKGKAHEFKYVIDGANVMFTGTAKININSYIQLDKVVNKLGRKNCLIVLHQRHFSINKKWKSKDKERVNKIIASWKHLSVRTPPGLNDDWFSILIAMETGTKIVTNDKFRDHKFQMQFKIQTLDIFAQWISDYSVGYEFNKYGLVKIHETMKYSERIQFNDGVFYIPLDNSNWTLIS